MSVKIATDMVPVGIEVFQNGSQPPGSGPFRTGLQVKRWRGNIGAYKSLGKGEDGKPGLLSQPALPNASTLLGPNDLNIPHIHHFTTWDEWRKGRPVSGTLDPMGNLIPRDWLFYPEEAADIAKLVSSDDGVVATAEEATDYRGKPFEFNYNDNRRIWKIRVGVRLFDMNDLWELRTRGTITGPTIGTNRGIGAPGSFILDSARLRWLPANQDDGSLETRTIPLPCRDLLPNEHVSVGVTLMDMNQVVVVTDDGIAQPPSGAGGGLTTEEHGMLKAVYDYATRT